MDFDKFEDLSSKPKVKYKRRKTKRTVVKEEGEIPDNAQKGLVISIIGTNVIVENSSGKNVNCVTAGIIISKNKDQTLITVGDFVEFILPDDEENIGMIVKVYERKNHFSRKAIIYHKEDVIAANIDFLIIMMSSISPDYNKRLIDRFLVTAELNNVKPMICINKIDIFDDDSMKDDLNVYQELGIDLFYISAKENIGIEPVLEKIKDKITVLVGPSGTGKSTFLNTVLQKNIQEVRETSSKTSKGKHTTSFARVYNLIVGGKIIDTPGIREFGIWGLPKNDLALYFHEFDKYNIKCKYYPCSHLHEPGCAVAEAIENSEIDFDRYESYVNMYHTLD